MAILNELLSTAQRFERWSRKQHEVSHAGSAAALAMEQARTRFSAAKKMDVDSSVFLESVLEGNDLMPVRYFQMGQVASRSVGRIHFDLGPKVGHGYATGFLVAPGLLLTNQHVFPTADLAAIATVTFDAEEDLNGLPKPPHVFRLEPARGYLSDVGLDFCFVCTAPVSTQGTSIADFGFLRLHSGTGKITRDEYATIIQHPKGRQKQVAARNNKIQVYVYDRELPETEAAQNQHIYYSTDTLAGSSGAPVFSDQWYVVALHRRGVPKTRTNAAGVTSVVKLDGRTLKDGESTEGVQYIANEGVRISRILRQVHALASSLDMDQRGAAGQIVRMLESSAVTTESGPFSTKVAAVNQASSMAGGGQGLGTQSALEVTRRKSAVFADAVGFDEKFLGVKVGLPVLSRALESAAARRLDDPDSYVLPFTHFSTVVHAKRRLPIFAAVNIDGGQLNPTKKPSRPVWSYDPRIDEAEQPDDSIFSDMVQRGHMAAREFMWWGPDEEAQEADIHSFTLTNVCPQIGSFNGQREWRAIERMLFQAAKDQKRKVVCFMGPFFSRSDPLYDALRSDNSTAAWDTGMRMPNKFWYILVWRVGTKLLKRAFILDHSDDIEEAGPLEFDFETPATVKEVSVAVIAQKTGLKFPGIS